MARNIYKSIEEIDKKRCENDDLRSEIRCLDKFRLGCALEVISYTDDEKLRKLFACYGKLLESKTKVVYLERYTGISNEEFRETLLRAIRAENKLSDLKIQLDRMRGSDKPPHYNLKKGDKIAYKSSITKEEIEKLMRLGLSQTEIADKLNCSRSTIWRRLQE